MQKQKVVIEITADGWKTDVHVNGKVFTEIWKRVPKGSKLVEGDFEKEGDVPRELYYALNDMGSHDVMKAL